MRDLKKCVRDLLITVRFWLDRELKSGQPVEDGGREDIIELCDEIEKRMKEE